MPLIIEERFLRYNLIGTLGYLIILYFFFKLKVLMITMRHFKLLKYCFIGFSSLNSIKIKKSESVKIKNKANFYYILFYKLYKQQFTPMIYYTLILNLEN